MFSQRLKEIRTQAGLSQRQLAAKLEVSQQSVAKWETGKSTPNPDMIAQIARLLRVSADDLVGGPDVPSPQLVALSAPKGYDQLTDDEKAEIEEIIAIYNKRRK